MKWKLGKEDCIVNSIVIFLLILSFSIILFITDFTGYFCMMIVSLFLTFTYSPKLFSRTIIKFSIMVLLSKIFLHIELGLASGALLGLIIIILKLFPIFTLGGILIYSSPLKIMSALRKIHLSNFMSISIVTGLRFMGEMKSRIQEIRNGMKIRGLKISILHPIKSFELYIIPLIYKCLHVSETLTSSIISRGVEYEGKKTSYKPVKFGLYDFAFIFIAIFLLWRSI